MGRCYKSGVSGILSVDQATLKTANDSLAASIAAAVDAGRLAMAEKQRCMEVVVKLLEQLAAYVQANCKNDMTILLSSGFTAKSPTKTAAPPASEAIRRIVPGDVTGQAKARLMRYPGAVSYELRWAPVPIPVSGRACPSRSFVPRRWYPVWLLR